MEQWHVPQPSVELGDVFRESIALFDNAFARIARWS
jgi:hypothetical protein